MVNFTSVPTDYSLKRLIRPFYFGWIRFCTWIVYPYCEMAFRDWPSNSRYHACGSPVAVGVCERCLSEIRLTNTAFY